MYSSARNDDEISKAENVKSRVKKGANDVEDDVQDTLSAVRDDLQDIARTAGRHAREFASTAEESIVTSIKEHPVKSVLIAAAAGFLVSILVRRD